MSAPNSQDTDSTAAPKQQEAPFVSFVRWWRAGHMAMSPVGGYPHDAEFIWKAAWDAALRSDRDAIIEECAQRCDSYAATGREMSRYAKGDRGSSYRLQSLAAESCAESIRALKKATPQAQHGPESVQGTTGSLLAAKRGSASGEAGSDATRKPAESAPSAQCVVVPIEPTEAMLLAGCEAENIHGESTCHAVWKAMLAAAPSAVPAVSATVQKERDLFVLDARRLDWLDQQGDPGVPWVARESGTGRGYRLHQDPRAREHGYKCGHSPRAAIDIAMDTPSERKQP